MLYFLGLRQKKDLKRPFWLVEPHDNNNYSAQNHRRHSPQYYLADS